MRGHQYTQSLKRALYGAGGAGDETWELDEANLPDPLSMCPVDGRRLEHGVTLFLAMVEDAGVDLARWEADCSKFSRKKQCYTFSFRNKQNPRALTYAVSLPAGWYKHDYALLRGVREIVSLVLPEETAARLKESQVKETE